MKKYFKVLTIFLFTFILSGCMKVNIGMDIGADKSMNLTITEAFADALLESSDESAFSDEDLSKIKKAGFTVKDYSADNMTGYTFTKKIDNIDSVSTEKKVTGDLGLGLDSSEEISDYLFSVKKGFFKNTYTAKLKSSDTDYAKDQMDTDSSDTSIGATDSVTTEESTTDDSTTDSTTSSISSNVDYSSLMSGMDMSFNVTLPYKALDSNATSVENDGKTLKWNLLSFDEDAMTFEFELYNMTNIYILAGIVVFLIVVLIIIIIKKHGKKNKTSDKNVAKPLKGSDMASVVQEISDNVQSANTTIPNNDVQKTSDFTSMQSVNTLASQNIPVQGNVVSAKPVISAENTVQPNNTNTVQPSGNISNVGNVQPGISNTQETGGNTTIQNNSTQGNISNL